MSLSLKIRKLQTFEICVLASRPQTSEAYLSATRGQIRLQFWIFTILIDPTKYTKFHENLRQSLPGAGWLGVEWPFNRIQIEFGFKIVMLNRYIFELQDWRSFTDFSLEGDSYKFILSLSYLALIFITPLFTMLLFNSASTAHSMW
jgi:hypothetical protein